MDYSVVYKGYFQDMNTANNRSMLETVGEDDWLYLYDESPFFLWTLHTTHPTEMDGETVHKQHDNLHRQIAAFEKLLQHAMNKFSREKLYGMLKIVTKDFNREYTPGEHVHSISHLKRIVDQIESHNANNKAAQDTKALSKETEKHVIKYFKTFFEDVEYMKELKKYFDEKIYICLYEYFYDPLDDIQESELEALMERYDADSGDQETNNQAGKEEEPDNSSTNDEKENDNQPKRVSFQEDVTEVYTGDRKEEEISFDFLSTKGKLSHAVRQMFKVNNKWDNILNDADPHMECYDPDSKYELLVFNDYVKYEAVLRLVPDMFVKAYKSVELAKLWWTQANKVYNTNTPRKRRTTIKELGKQEGELSQTIERVTEDIQRMGATVISRERDLEELTKRENRYHTLSDQCEKLEERKDDVTQTYTSIMTEMHLMKQELQVLEKGTNGYKELEARLKETDKKLMLTEDELKVLAYHFHIMQEDFNLEMELRPHLIRFRADIEGKITDLKQDIEFKITQQKKTEKMMVLLKTNCDRMKHIMQKLNLVDDEESFIESTGTPEKQSTDIEDDKHHNSTGKSPAQNQVKLKSNQSNVKNKEQTNNNPNSQKDNTVDQKDQINNNVTSKTNPKKVRSPLVELETTSDKSKANKKKSSVAPDGSKAGLENDRNGKGPSKHSLPPLKADPKVNGSAKKVPYYPPNKNADRPVVRSAKQTS